MKEGVLGWAYRLVRRKRDGQQSVLAKCQEKYLLTVVPLGRER
jgi:hypothetical protein